MINYNKFSKKSSLVLSALLLTFICANLYENQGIALANQNSFYLNKLNFCPITKETKNDYEPEIFSSSNNLLRKSGEVPNYCGERIVIYGKILDQNCVPISDAKVRIWHVDCKGKYPYTPLKNRVNKQIFRINKDSTFLGNGTTITNNKGEFFFITTYPGNINNKSGKVNFRISHDKFKEHNTTIMLNKNLSENEIINPELSIVVPMIKEMGSPLYSVNIVINEKTLDSY